VAYPDARKIDRIAWRAYQTMYVNTGALLQVDLDREAVSVVAVSASAPLNSHYPFSGEAPRVHSDAPVTLAVWRRWTENIIAQELERGELSGR
jgi:hypothetical protein